MSETDAVQVELPAELAAELTKMRRNPALFKIQQAIQCKFCGKPKTGLALINAKFPERQAGSWCPIHGWLFFDSVAFPPTERLTASEIEDRELERRRKRGPRATTANH